MDGKKNAHWLSRKMPRKICLAVNRYGIEGCSCRTNGNPQANARKNERLKNEGKDSKQRNHLNSNKRNLFSRRLRLPTKIPYIHKKPSK